MNVASSEDSVIPFFIAIGQVFIAVDAPLLVTPDQDKEGFPGQDGVPDIPGHFNTVLVFLLYLARRIGIDTVVLGRHTGAFRTVRATILAFPVGAVAIKDIAIQGTVLSVHGLVGSTIPGHDFFGRTMDIVLIVFLPCVPKCIFPGIHFAGKAQGEASRIKFQVAAHHHSGKIQSHTFSRPGIPANTRFAFFQNQRLEGLRSGIFKKKAEHPSIDTLMIQHIFMKKLIAFFNQFSDTT